MNAQEFRKLLQETDDKLSIFASSETLRKCEFSINELVGIIRDFLSDEEISKLFDYSHFTKLDGFIKYSIIKLISDENVILQMLANDSIMNGVAIPQILNIIKIFSDEGKKQLLHIPGFVNNHQLTYIELRDIIYSLSDESRVEILTDIDLITNNLHLTDFKIAILAKSLSSEEAKKKILEIYPLSQDQKIDIITTFSVSSRLDILLKEQNLTRSDKITILQSLDVETLSEFLVRHKEFCFSNDIHPYEIILGLDDEQQKDFVAHLEHIDLTLNEKRAILAVLKETVKQSIDTTNFPEEYKTALSIQTTKSRGRVILDLDRDLADYQGLDNLMRIYPEEFTSEQRARFIKICDICPNLQVVSNVNSDDVEYTSTGSEYKEAEEWIVSLIDSLNPEYSKAQKMAVIDNAIGKK